MKTLLRAGVALLALSVAGCGSISDMSTGTNGQRIFGGVRKDSTMITHPDSSPVEVSVTLGILDFPFSLVLDTALLPITFIIALIRGH
jgi:uncharacterized protein YceK